MLIVATKLERFIMRRAQQKSGKPKVSGNLDGTPFMLLFRELYFPDEEMGRPSGAVATARSDITTTTYSSAFFNEVADDTRSDPD